MLVRAGGPRQDLGPSRKSVRAPRGRPALVGAQGGTHFPCPTPTAMRPPPLGGVGCRGEGARGFHGKAGAGDVRGRGLARAVAGGGSLFESLESIALESVDVDVGAEPIRLVLPADIDVVIDMYIALDRLDRDPYWCRPWPSAVALAAEILRRPELVRGKRVCDVGAGLGLEGLAAAMAGASQVIMYDREELALHCSLLSARANGLTTGPPPVPGLAAPPGVEATAPRPGGGRVEARFLDWADPTIDESFDVVMACDVLYEEYSVRPVAEVVPKLLAPGGKLLLADPPNRTAQNRERFLEILRREVGMVMEEKPVREAELEGGVHQVQIMVLRGGGGAVKDTLGLAG